jgi:hypothetical protein
MLEDVLKKMSKENLADLRQDISLDRFLKVY